MQSNDELPDLVGKKLETAGKDIPWLAESLSLSEETVRAWMRGEQPLPDNKRAILDAFVRAGGGITRPGGESRKPLSPDVVINSH